MPSAKHLVILLCSWCCIHSIGFSEEENNAASDSTETEHIIEKNDNSKKEEENDIYPCYNPKKFKYLKLRVLNKATSVVKDVTFTPENTSYYIFDLKINCEEAFEEKVNNALYVCWAFLEIHQERNKNEPIILYSDWFNDLKSIFKHPDYDIKIMGFK